eukprot:gene1874-1015_t
MEWVIGAIVFTGSLALIPVGYKCIYQPISQNYSLSKEAEYHSILNTEERENAVDQEDSTQNDSWMNEGGGYVEMGNKTENSLSERLKKLPYEKEEKIDIMKFVKEEDVEVPNVLQVDEPFGQKFQERLKEEKTSSTKEPLLSEENEETVINMRNNDQFYLPPKI